MVYLLTHSIFNFKQTFDKKHKDFGRNNEENIHRKEQIKGLKINHRKLNIWEWKDGRELETDRDCVVDFKKCFKRQWTLLSSKNEESIEINPSIQAGHNAFGGDLR